MGPIFKKWDAEKANNDDKSDFFIWKNQLSIN